MEATCAHCKKTATEATITTLLQCGGCKKVQYCSRECQSSEWKAHKKECQHKPKEPSAPSASNDSNSTRPVQTLPENKYPNTSLPVYSSGIQEMLENLPEEEVYRRLIDCYRFRVEDEYVWGANLTGLYNGDNPSPQFHKFLVKAEKRKTILPKWWSLEKRKACEVLARGSLPYAVEKEDIKEEYGDALMPMKLRMLANDIYGKGFGSL